MNKSLGCSSVIQKFELCSEVYSEKVAVKCNDETLTYTQLNESSNQLAHYLIESDVGPGSMVAICMDRSINMVVAILGVLKAGAAYVPLDPQYPMERVKFILEETQAEYVICTASLQYHIPEAWQTKTILLDSLDTKKSRTNPNITRLAEHTAYIIFTSGTTGQPKGVCITNGNMVRLFTQTEQLFNFDHMDVWTLFHSFSFDFSVWEIFGCLLYGGTLIIVPFEVSRSPEEFWYLIIREQVTILNQTPSAFWQMTNIVKIQESSAQLKLRKIIFGGEKLSLQHLKVWLHHFQDSQPSLINMYGITETTVHVTYHEIVRSVVLESGVIGIGKPLADLNIYLLDETLQLVGDGQVGEMYISGNGLAKEYLNRPELTAERFIPNPFGAGRLYKTGDLACLMPNGEYKYLGRNDGQVKIRGFRIELDEINQVLLNHPMVKDVVTVSEKDALDIDKLVSYIVANRTNKARISYSEQIDEWKDIFEDVYSQKTDNNDGEELNLAGWRSSIDNKSIPQNEMLEWVNNTVERIQSLKPINVLEIGCGTGLLLTKILPKVRSYIATDLSELVTKQHSSDLVSYVASGRLRILNQQASDFSNIEFNSVDTIIINSVIQYFPDGEYFIDVIKKSVARVQPGGVVFIGDVRSKHLMELFYFDCEWSNQDSNVQLSKLNSNILKRRMNEKELLVHPNFFYALSKEIEGITHVEILPKRGKHHNELTKYRYDVILHVGKPITNVLPEISYIDKEKESLSTFDIIQKLQLENPDAIAITNIKNNRLAGVIKYKETIDNNTLIPNIKDHRWPSLDPLLDAEGAYDLDEWEQVFERIGYRSYISWGNVYANGNYDLILTKIGNTLDPKDVFQHKLLEYRNTESLHSFYNEPSVLKYSQEMSKQLRQFLNTKLPSHMIPSSFVSITQIPITVNGKTDFSALSKLQRVHQSEKVFVPPTNQYEELICDQYATYLNYARVGIEDDFFYLGGDSLIAARLLTNIRKVLNVGVQPSAIFKYSKIADLAAYIKQLKENLVQDSYEHPRNRAVQKVQKNASSGQKRMLFINQLLPDSPIYNVPITFYIKGELNLHALQSSTDIVIQRHKALRTAFRRADQELVPYVMEVDRSVMDVVDLTRINSDVLQTVLSRKIESKSAIPFDLEKDLLLRSYVFKLDQEEHIILLVTHHIAVDTWSLNIMLEEISAQYYAFIHDQKIVLPELKKEYADFAHWQNSMLTEPLFQHQLAYWKNKLNGIDRPSSVPFKYRIMDTSNKKAGHYSFDIPHEIWNKIIDFCQIEKITVYMCLLAVLKILMFKYSGSQNVVVGTPVANRNLKEYDNVIGFFVNMLALNTEIRDDISIKQLIERVRMTVIEGFDNQDIPFEMVVKELQPERMNGESPFFNVVFQVEQKLNFTLSDLDIQFVEHHFGFAKYDLYIGFEEMDGRLRGKMEYDAGKFEDTVIARMSSHFLQVLNKVLENVLVPIQQVTYISDVEKEMLLYTWNRSHVQQKEPIEMAYSSNRYKCFEDEELVHRLFERQVDLNYDAIAIRSTDKSLTYGEVNEQANQLARYLISQGVGPESLVGLHLAKSMRSIVLMLAILKAGGAFLPIDPDYPSERIKFMIEDSGAFLVISESEAEIKSQHPNVKIVNLSKIPESVIPCDRNNLDVGISKRNLAYVIYTSGSTGQPKGVYIEHGSVINLISSHIKIFNITPEDKILQFSSLSFDASVTDIFPCLAAGATLCVGTSEELLPGENLVTFIQNNQITRVTLPPSVLSVLPEEAMNIKSVTSAGEPCSLKLANKWSQCTRFYNAYGPTEGTVCTTVLEFNHLSNRVTLGKTIDNVQAYILDRNLDPVPIGIVGELFIGGKGLARGYANRPGLTAEKFIPHPYSNTLGARLYRTGDLATYDENGDIVYVGRVDNQLKIRGYRIETEEIELTIKQLAYIQEAAIIPNIKNNLQDYITAYIVSDSETVTVDLIKTHLMEKLPFYMIPSKFVFIDQIPLNISGKIDKKKLLEMESSQEETNIEPKLNKSTDKEIIRNIWQEVLGTQVTNYDVSFFEIGGHSLLLTDLHNRLTSHFGDCMSMMDLFRYPTIHTLIAFINSRNKGESNNKIPTTPDSEKHSRNERLLNLRNRRNNFRADK
ncbi:hypothetical protein BBG47_14435 [Paenibacillus sp. KS1]|uniref:non-ribosomal peptide synthetase n=1 Tax=Paenibacillus sp. KS1 TaxID=1849249 RepID=UPI0008066F91|nr:non-ribosomal peptide synthetase [Paenibacillus sp. KS1]OBY78851.1 hypothetical protein BBG47_14435 [Paenibacillus sp. KS1]